MEKKYPVRVEEKLLTVITSRCGNVSGTGRGKEGRVLLLTLYILCCCYVFKSSPHIIFLKLTKAYIVEIYRLVCAQGKKAGGTYTKLSVFCV